MALASRPVAHQLNLNSEIGMGSTADPAVPSGHWPDGTGRMLALGTDVGKSSGAFPVPSGESPLGTGQWPVPPAGMATAISEFRPIDVRRLIPSHLKETFSHVKQLKMVFRSFGARVKAKQCSGGPQPMDCGYDDSCPRTTIQLPII